LEKLHTDPKVYYRSKREWVRKIGEASQAPPEKGKPRG